MSPLFVRLGGQTVLLVGAGVVARRKAQALVRGGAQLKVVAPSISDDIRELVCAEQLIEDTYKIDYLQGVQWVVAATNNPDVNMQIYRDAQQANIPINLVDRADLSSFALPSVVRRDPLLIAIGSGGASPVLTRAIRSRIEASIPASFGDLATLMARFRDRVKTTVSSLEVRRRLWQDVVDGPIAEAVFSGNPSVAERLLVQSIEQAGETFAPQGEVFLVGAGPGDPDLLTVKAVRLMQLADVVLHDNLVSDAIMDMTRADAERVYVGKRASRHAMPQEEISQLLVDFALQGKRVLRLKGGDPFIFGRGGEEIELLSKAKIPFQVVPGITAAAGCGAYAGIPLTHRDCAQSVRFITGHLARPDSSLPWQELVQPHQTIVFYMGLIGLPVICEKLIEHGLSHSHPIALVEKGTLPEQRVVVGQLGNIVEKITEQGIKGPTLIIMGEVVNKRDQLQWFDIDSKNLP